MNGAARRARYAVLREAAPDGRGARFARRLTGAPVPFFADIAKVPEWLGAPPETRARIAALAMLLRHRVALDAELSGPRLAMIAAAVGEDLLDAACEIPLPADGALGPLPAPERIIPEGEALLQAGLPLPFAARFPGACDDPAARALTERAHHIVKALA